MKCGGKFRHFNHEDCQRWLCWCKAWACSAASRWGSDQSKSHVDMLSVITYIDSDCLVTFLRNWNFAVAQSLPPQAVEAPEQEAMREGGLQESPKAQAKSPEISELNSTSVTCVHSHYGIFMRLRVSSGAFLSEANTCSSSAQEFRT